MIFVVCDLLFISLVGSFETAEVIPSPDPLTVDDSALEALGEMIRSQPSTWPRAELRGRAPIDVLCTMGSTVGEEATPAARGWSLYVLASNAVNLEQVGVAGFEAVTRLVENASCWQVPADRAESAARAESK